MDYRDCLELAGATVHQYERFGSYQGDWWALVTFNGVTGWVHGSYGSCSGCDQIEAAMDSHEHGDDYIYSPEDWTPESCDRCKSLVEVMRGIGASYLDDVVSQSDAESKAVEHIEWDSEAETVLAFLKQHANG